MNNFMNNQLSHHLLNSALYYVVKRDFTGIYTYANQAYLQRFSHLSTTLIGQSPAQTLYSDKDIEKLNDALSEVISSPNKIVSTQLRKKDGKGGYWWVYWDFSAIKDEQDNVVEILSIGHDITNAYNSQLRMLEYAQKVNAILASITDGFCVVNTAWNIIRVNKVLGEMIGIDSSELSGRNFWTIFPKDSQHQYVSAFEQTMYEKQTMRIEEFYNQKYFIITSYPSSEGITFFFQDITDKKNKEKEINNIYKIFSKGPAVAFKWTLQTQGGLVLYCAPNVSIFGYDP